MYVYIYIYDNYHCYPPPTDSLVKIAAGDMLFVISQQHTAFVSSKMNPN